MSVANLPAIERVWLSAYHPGVPADVEAEIDRYPSLREVFLEHVEKYRQRVAYVSIGTEMGYDEWERQVFAFAGWLQSRG
ncbi:long-chain fatty acid--CoA ligase, partial [Pantoea sp. B9002]|nr:long-chain fatty acid--CoA ligase [Pantoea sp. B9002]